MRFITFGSDTHERQLGTIEKKLVVTPGATDEAFEQLETMRSSLASLAKARKRNDAIDAKTYQEAVLLYEETGSFLKKNAAARYLPSKLAYQTAGEYMEKLKAMLARVKGPRS